MASEYESTLLEAWQRKQDAIPVLLSDNLRKEREIAALREQLATTASDGDQTLTMLVNAQNEALLAEVERLTQELARAEAANTAVIRANAEEIADLEDVRDALEAKVNALTADVERLTLDSCVDCGSPVLICDHAAKNLLDPERSFHAGQIEEMTTERDALAAQVAALREAGDLLDAALTNSAAIIRDACAGVVTVELLQVYQAEGVGALEAWRAALAAAPEARDGEGSEMRTVGEAYDELQRETQDWVLWAHRLEDAVLANPVECHCWDNNGRNGTQGHMDACAEWRQIAEAIRTKPKMAAGPRRTD